MSEKPLCWQQWLEHGHKYALAGAGKGGHSKFSPDIVYNLFSMSLESYCMAILDYYGTLPDNHTFTDLMNALDGVCRVDPDLKHRILALEKCQQICAFDDFMIAKVDAAVNREFQSVVQRMRQMACLQCNAAVS